MRRSSLAAASVASLIVAAVAGATAARSTGGEVVISQRDKQFQPGSVEVDARQPVVIVNDDGETVHHAYVESDTFNFDSGDQGPKTRTTIVFPTAGEYQVLCGIHPKMKLAVRVRGAPGR